MRIDFGFLQANGAVYILDPPATVADHFGYFLEKEPAVHSFPPVIIVGEMKTNIPQVGGAQKRVTDGMHEHVRIRVTHGAFQIRDLYSAEKKVVALFKRMNIETQSYS
jgi:hypothetical protein